LVNGIFFFIELEQRFEYLLVYF